MIPTSKQDGALLSIGSCGQRLSTRIYFNYLVATPSLYTQDQLKAYKSLDAYNFYVNGWVSDISVVSLASRPGAFLALVQVKHSQRVSATPLKPWIAVEKVGTVLCAQCTCMAGLGEACSHIAALLFALEANTQMKKRFSCTSLPCSWLPPSFHSVPYALISEIDFSTPRQKRKKTCESVSAGQDKIESSSTGANCI